MHFNRKDLTGMRFGSLTATRPTHVNGRTAWECVCDCGAVTVVLSGNLTRRHTVSCGCKKQNTSLGFVRRGSKEHVAWVNMKARCDRKSHPDFKNYGARGISYDPEWKDFELFFRDMGRAPKGLTLDRIDNNKGYSKENCRWATIKTQLNNTRRSKPITIDGETHPLAEWAKRFGINKATVKHRMRKGISAKDALTAPVKPVVST